MEARHRQVWEAIKMSMPLSIDSKVAVVDRLGADSKHFKLSMLIFKNFRALYAIKEIGTLKNELFDFAKDPSVGLHQLGPEPPKPKREDDMSDEDWEKRKQEYLLLYEQWEAMKRALSMGVSTEDLMAIEQYLEPYDDVINATPAVKGKRWHSLTKDVNEQQQGFGLFKRSQNQQQ